MPTKNLWNCPSNRLKWMFDISHAVSAAANLPLDIGFKSIFTHAVFSVSSLIFTLPPCLPFSLSHALIPLPSSAACDGYRSDMSQLKGLQGLWCTGFLGRRGRSQIDLSLRGRSKCANKAPRSSKFSFGSRHSNLMCFWSLVEESNGERGHKESEKGTSREREAICYCVYENRVKPHVFNWTELVVMSIFICGVICAKCRHSNSSARTFARFKIWALARLVNKAEC